MASTHKRGPCPRSSSQECAAQSGRCCTPTSVLLHLSRNLCLRCRLRRRAPVPLLLLGQQRERDAAEGLHAAGGGRAGWLES